jgi:type I restriction enzyme S subunit
MNSSNWHRLALGDVTQLQLSSVDKKTKPAEQKILLCNYTDVYRNDVIHSDMEFMPATATEREVSNCSLLAGDVVITKDSEKYDDIGVPAFIKDNISDLVCGYHLAILRPVERIISGRYLFYTLKTPETQHQFYARANGVTRFGLRKDDIKSVEIPVPSLHYQDRIAHVLGTLDDKIELNRRMCETLEEMARALFKSWFVNFDPVRAKMEGYWQPGESLPGLPARLYDLFPDRLRQSGAREVPEGWQNVTLGQLSKKPQYGYTASGTSDPVGPHYLRITDINKAPVINWQAVPYCRITPDDHRKYRLYEGDILIARLADPGHACVVEDDTPAVFASYLIRFSPIRANYTRFLQFWLRSGEYWDLVRQRSTGTTRGNLNARVLSGFPILLPPSPLLNAFDSVISTIRRKSVTRIEESNALAELRNTLLPRLISGDLRVCYPEA